MVTYKKLQPNICIIGISERRRKNREKNPPKNPNLIKVSPQIQEMQQNLNRKKNK